MTSANGSLSHINGSGKPSNEPSPAVNGGPMHNGHMAAGNSGSNSYNPHADYDSFSKQRSEGGGYTTNYPRTNANHPPPQNGSSGMNSLPNGMNGLNSLPNGINGHHNGMPPLQKGKAGPPPHQNGGGGHPAHSTGQPAMGMNGYASAGSQGTPVNGYATTGGGGSGGTPVSQNSHDKYR